MRHVLMQSVLLEVNGVVSSGLLLGVWCEVGSGVRGTRCEDAAEVGLARQVSGADLEWKVVAVLVVLSHLHVTCYVGRL